MCGIVGLVRSFKPEASLGLSGLDAACSALASWEPSTGPAALVKLTRSLEALSFGLVDWAGLQTLRLEASALAQVEALATALERVAEAADAHLSLEEESSEAGEALAQAIVGVRDVAWRIRRDALPNLTAVTHFASAAESFLTAPLETKGWFELWRLNLVLNQLARLEVRGRDSGGLGILVVFSHEDWAALSTELASAGLADDLKSREAIEALRDNAVLRSTQPERVSLGFVHKVAKEVGELGANVRDLRAKLESDALCLRLISDERATVQVIAHTRWASNGIISEPNCHPVANDLVGTEPQSIVFGVLNGDVDNYPTLREGYPIPSACTTDAKIIPVEIAARAESEESFWDAFTKAVTTFHGSTAIGAVTSDDPGAVYLSQRGSGQAIYIGAIDGGGYLFASELYGVVELAPRFYKLDGERGELVRLAEGELKVRSFDGTERVQAITQLAPIATRDIDRGGFPHYFLKEIYDAPRSVERTLRGKFRSVEGEAQFLLGEDVVPRAVREGLASGSFRRVFIIGQGTAAVAGLAVADFMGRLLAPKGLSVLGLPATDLSGFLLDQVGPDTLVIAVSQSGTTTDTNRTVDLVRERGAQVIAIVNRRGSDLADKAQGVLYTSDGRDVEMSVASTKAFYCQVVAGYLLALYMAQGSKAISAQSLSAHLLRLEDLPRCLQDVLDRCRERARRAARLAIRKRHWTVVGSGPLRHAAREIRIKLSELSYKSVSVDTIEDKKHIDLSSEPMILVCAAGLTGAAAADAVKEVAIFKAHAAIPIVICDQGETRFAEYSAATIEVPASSPEVALLLNTIAGHVFSYEVARAIDELTTPLRRARELVQAALDEVSGEDPQAATETLTRARAALSSVRHEVEQAVQDGRWNAGSSSDQAVRLCLAFDLERRGVGVTPPSPKTRLELLLTELVAGIDELRRPIDAIKHQAKTVTVGISREAGATRAPAGPLIDALVEAGAQPGAVADQDAAALAGLEPALDQALGAVVYRLEGLSPLGAPTDESRLEVAGKSGVALGMASRADTGAPLRGTKRSVVRAPRVWLGHGQRDGRALVLCPLYSEGQVTGLGLVHIRFKAELTQRVRVRALKAVGRYEDLKCAVTEWDLTWEDSYLDEFSSEELLTASPERIAEGIRRREGASEALAGTQGESL
ncbi:MAG: SIS domain-containing protein [Planctomycetes bacterium]|nr:SIS domain-containing protein [Planctomycetota bacterium]